MFGHVSLFSTRNARLAGRVHFAIRENSPSFLMLPYSRKIPYLVYGHDGAVVLGLGGGCARCGNRNHIVDGEQVVVGEIGDVGCHDAVLDRRLRSSFFTSPPRAKIEDAHTLFHEREFVFVKHALGSCRLSGTCRDM